MHPTHWLQAASPAILGPQSAISVVAQDEFSFETYPAAAGTSRKCLYLCGFVGKLQISAARRLPPLHSLPEIRHPKPLPPPTHQPARPPGRLAGISLHLFLYTICISTAASLSGFPVTADKSGRETLRWRWKRGRGGKIQEIKGEVGQNASLIQLPFCRFNLSTAFAPPPPPPLHHSDYQPRGEGFSMWLAFLSSQSGAF